MLEKLDSNCNRNYVVKGVGSRSDSETPNSKKGGKIYSCNRSESESHEIKRINHVWSAAEKINMMVRAE